MSQEDKTRILGLVAGLGSGKTYALCLKTIMLALDNVGFVGLVAPTLPLDERSVLPQL